MDQITGTVKVEMSPGMAAAFKGVEDAMNELTALVNEIDLRNNEAGKKTDAAPKAKKAKAVEEPETDDSEEESFELSNDESEETEEDSEPTITKADMLKVLKAHPAKDKVTKLLQTKFKVKNINELKDSQYADVVEAVKKLK